MKAISSELGEEERLRKPVRYEASIGNVRYEFSVGRVRYEVSVGAGEV